MTEYRERRSRTLEVLAVLLSGLLVLGLIMCAEWYKNASEGLKNGLESKPLRVEATVLYNGIEQNIQVGL